MSTTQKEYVSLFLRGLMVVMVSVIGFFFYKMYEKVESTHEIVIRLGVEVEVMQEDVTELKRAKSGV